MKAMVEEMYQLYYWELLRYMRRNTSSEAEAEDIVQETFLRALQHEDQIDTMERASCRAWLYRTAKNVQIDRIRHVQAEPEPEEMEWAADDLTRTEVLEICGKLEEGVQKLFWLRYFEGYNASELGRMFKMKPSTVRAKLLGARKTLASFYPEFNQKGRNENEKIKD